VARLIRFISRAGLRHLHGRIFTRSSGDGNRLRVRKHGFDGTRKTAGEPIALRSRSPPLSSQHGLPAEAVRDAFPVKSRSAELAERLGPPRMALERSSGRRTILVWEWVEGEW
jgi:hypothetical protein